MKWAQLKKRLDDEGVDPSERKIFKVYEDKYELEQDLKDPQKFVVWVEYPGVDNGFKSFGNLGRKAQRKYEVFCGGFLYYHDVKFKKYAEGAGYEYPDTEGPNISPKWKKYPHKDFDHKIYFKWLKDNEEEDLPDEVDSVQNEEKKNKKKNKVIIYITPTPPEFNSDPPKPPPPPPPESND